MQSLGAQIITMPDLDNDVVDVFDDKSLTYSAVLQPGVHSISTRTCVKFCLSDAEPGVNQAAAYLGLGDAHGG